MSVIQSYRDLRVWQAGMDLAKAAYGVTKSWPKEEMFGMTSQVRRSEASVPANIAEGFGRGSSGSFVQFLRTTQGSLKEFETHVLLAGRVGLLQQQDADLLLGRSDDLGKMLGSLIRKAAPSPTDRVKRSPYGVRPTTDDRRPTLLDEAKSQ